MRGHGAQCLMKERRLGGGAAHDARAAPLAQLDDAVVAEFSVGPQDGAC